MAHTSPSVLVADADIEDTGIILCSPESSYAVTVIGPRCERCSRSKLMINDQIIKFELFVNPCAKITILYVLKKRYQSFDTFDRH